MCIFFTFLWYFLFEFGHAATKSDHGVHGWYNGHLSAWQDLRVWLTMGDLVTVFSAAVLTTNLSIRWANWPTENNQVAFEALLKPSEDSKLVWKIIEVLENFGKYNKENPRAWCKLRETLPELCCNRASQLKAQAEAGRASSSNSSCDKTNSTYNAKPWASFYTYFWLSNARVAEITMLKAVFRIVDKLCKLEATETSRLALKA